VLELERATASSALMFPSDIARNSRKFASDLAMLGSGQEQYPLIQKNLMLHQDEHQL
jgi:hypothetical protein